MSEKKEVTDYLITISDHDDSYNVPKQQAPWKIPFNKKNNINFELPRMISENIIDKMNITNKSDGEKITYVYRNFKIKNKKILKFIEHCIINGFFDDTFYDYSNNISIVATKLPDTFCDISGDNKFIIKKQFISFFSKSGFNDNIEYVYDQIDNNENGFIDWDEFKTFFLQFIKNITY